MSNITSLNDLDNHLDFNNFDPDDIQVEETINAVFIIDVSPSTSGYMSDMNAAFNDFVQTMQQSHIHDRLFVSMVEFDDDVRVVSGFQPIAGVPVTTFKCRGGGTALYDAVGLGIKNAIDYRENLEKTGISVKTLIFVITDGEDNSSSLRASAIKTTLDSIMKSESNAFSFTTILFGVGEARYFTKAKAEMGFQHLAIVGNTGKEIKKMISFISSSISKSSSGANPVDTQF
jgi:uncharacterized protein YegL